MTPSSVIEHEFLRRLDELFREFNASLTAEDHWTGYPECGEDVRMTISIPGLYNQKGEPIREHTEIDLGSSYEPSQGGAE